jgi:hypothetical protein
VGGRGRVDERRHGRRRHATRAPAPPAADVDCPFLEDGELLSQAADGERALWSSRRGGRARGPDGIQAG